MSNLMGVPIKFYRYGENWRCEEDLFENAEKSQTLGMGEV